MTSIAADEAIIEAVLDLMAEGSTMEALSIEAIAARAGVGKATIYRRWPGKEALLRDALRTLKGKPPVLAGRSVRDDLVTLLSTIGGNPDARALRIMPCLIPEVHRSPEQRRLYEEMSAPRREAMREVLRRGVESGELRADLDIEVCVMMMSGPMLMQKLLRWRSEADERELAERVVDTILGGMRSAVGPAGPPGAADPAGPAAG